ncbi:MAG TPA: MFS transporter [Xanthomonadales bacterium]|nr:MFS transporter [Xanthomonadales bacterium]
MNHNRMQRRRSLAGVIAAMAVVNLVYGITFPLLALVLDGQGVSKTLIGLSTMSQAAAILVIAPLAPRLLRRFAPARMMQTVSVVLALLFILAGLIPNVWFWFPLRFVVGALNSMLWISSEALINELADENWRGRIIGIYSSVGAAGFALGPLLLIATGSEGMLPFYSTSVLVLSAAIPLFVAREYRLKPSSEETASGIWAVFLLAPTIMLANVVYASAAESIVTFFPLFGLHLGISENFSLWLLTMIGVGSMVLILPLSWLADHVNRMGLLVVCIALTMLGLLAMPYVLQHALFAQLFAFVFGGVEGMIYALGVILIGERFKGSMLAAASASFTAAWAVGTVTGPFLVGAGMDYFGADRMMLIIFCFFALYLPLPLRAWVVSVRAHNSRPA